jgi:hypothetical protein
MTPQKKLSTSAQDGNVAGENVAKEIASKHTQGSKFKNL